MSTPSGPYDPTNPSASGGQPPQYPPQYPPPYPGYPTYPGYPPQPQPYPPQPYGQPVYPGYPVPPQPQRGSNRTLWIVLGVVGGVLLLACISCAVLFVVLGSQFANNPIFASTITVSSFCTDEETQQYDAAYRLFSTNLQSTISQSQFVANSLGNDAARGTVTACNPAPSDQTPQQADATSASFLVTVTRGGSSGSVGVTTGGGTTTTGTITVIKENGSWKIDSIDSSLGLT